MILVDSGVWIDHLRHGDPLLADRLNSGLVFTHPFIVGEVALGSLRQQDAVLGAMRGLPVAVLADDLEVQTLIERQPLHGLGIGYIDAHLLAATLLTPGIRLWTRDKRLHEIATTMGVAAFPAAETTGGLKMPGWRRDNSRCPALISSTLTPPMGGNP